LQQPVQRVGSTKSVLKRYWREGLLILVPALSLIGFFSSESIPQDPTYHNFADQRVVAGIPNFANVASNIPFLAVGALGLVLCLRRRGSSAPWTAFFVGIALVCFGSGYYHLLPQNATLVWDRLPITLAFMGLFVALLSEHIDESLGRLLLVPALAVGAASVGWWRYADDLRFYFWVQFTPLLVIPVLLALFSSKYTHRVYLLYGVGSYVLAKIAEIYDQELFALTSNFISGHSVKHILAALAALFVYLMLRQRRPIASYEHYQ
jgi:hypothetical protein